MGNGMTRVLEARKAFEQARAEAKALVDRHRALLGLAMIQAREAGEESQSTIAAGMNVGPQQVRAYEQAYRDWVREHPKETLDPAE